MCLPSFLRRCGRLWFGAKGMLDLVFWISHLCHEDKKSEPVKGMLWKPKCGSFIYSWMICLFAFMYKLLCDTVENDNNFEWEAPGFFRIEETEAKCPEGIYREQLFIEAKPGSGQCLVGSVLRDMDILRPSGGLHSSTYRVVHCPQLQHANSKCV